MRSSTVKVHMKTHSDAENPRVIKIKIEPKNEDTKHEEEKVFANPMKISEERKVHLDRLPTRPFVKEEILKRPENRVLKPQPLPLNRISMNLNQENNANRVEFNRMKQQYSVSATITSSRDNVFETSNRSQATMAARKRIPLMMPSLNGLDRRGGCLLNRNSPSIIASAISLLNVKNREKESDQLFS